MTIQQLINFIDFIDTGLKSNKYFKKYELDDNSHKEYYSMTFIFEHYNAKFSDCIILDTSNDAVWDEEEILGNIRNIIAAANKALED